MPGVSSGRKGQLRLRTTAGHKELNGTLRFTVDFLTRINKLSKYRALSGLSRPVNLDNILNGVPAHWADTPASTLPLLQGTLK